MSFDRFASGLQLPNVGSGVSPRASDSSDFLRLYFKTDQLYHTDEAGTEVQLTGLGLAFDDLTDKASGTGTYATTGSFTSGLGSGGVSLTANDGGGNANVTFNHESMTPEQTGNAGRIHVNTDLTSGASMQFQVGSNLTAGVSAGITTYFTIEENLLTADAAFKLLDSKELRFGTGTDWAFQYNGTDAYMDLDSGTWRWRDGANSNAVRIQWTPSAGLEFQDGHQLQLGTSNDLRMYHASNINYFDLVNGDLKIRDVSGTATDRFVFTQDGELGIGNSSPETWLHVQGPGLGGTAGDAEDLVIIRNQSNTTSGNDDRIVFTHERITSGTGWDTAGMRIGRRVDTTEMGYIQFGHSVTTDGDLITFGDDAAELMRLTPQGKFGIGTTTPDVDLHVAGGLRVETSSDFDSGTDTNKTASIVLPDTGEIAFDTGDFIRTLISKTSGGYINVGQNGTGIINRVQLLPGTSGAVYVQSDNNNALVINNNGSGNARMQYQIAGSNKYNVGVNAANSNYTIYDVVNSTTPFRIEPGSGNDGALTIDGSGDIASSGVIESTSGGFKFPDGTTQTTSASAPTFNTITGKTSGTGEYSTTGYLTAGRGNGGVSLTHNDGGGNANVTFNHKGQRAEQNGNAGRIRVNTDATTGAAMRFQVGSGLTSGAVSGLTTYFTVAEDALEANANFTLLDSKKLRLGSGFDFQMYFNGSNTIFDADAGDLYIQDNGTTRFTFARTTGNFTATGNVTAYSDARLKENIEGLEPITGKVEQLRPVRYDRNDVDRHEFGLIAQEVREVFPEVVVESDTGTLSIDYGKLSTVAIKAIQELKSEVDELKEMLRGITS